MAPPKPLLNSYIIVRHGRSEANEAGIIVSDPELGQEKYDLTPTGREQVLKTARELSDLLGLGNPPAIPLQIYSSPFLRTRTTAGILHDDGFPTSPDVIFDDRLCERFFGMWDGKQDTNYQQIWDEDEIDNLGTLNNWGCESTEEVASRAWSLVKELEKESAQLLKDAQDGEPKSDTNGLLPPVKTCIFVAHGDVLQILQTRFLDVPSHTHRSLEHMETAGWWVSFGRANLIY